MAIGRNDGYLISNIERFCGGGGLGLTWEWSGWKCGVGGKEQPFPWSMTW